MLTGHGGDITRAAEEFNLSPDDIFDFSTIVNPLGPPPHIREALLAGVDDLARYPDLHCRALRQKLADRFELSPDQILVGAGATELLHLIPRAFRPRRVSLLAPCYQDYWRAAAETSAEVEGLVTSADNEFRHKIEHLRGRIEVADMVVLGNPNNPTGALIAREDLLQLAAQASHVRFVVDEALVEFTPDPASQSLLGVPLPENIIVVRSLSTFFAVPGLRLGFAVAHPDLIQQLEREKEPWTVSSPAMRVGQTLHDDDAYIAGTRALIAEQRAVVSQELGAVTGIDAVPTAANFHLLRIQNNAVTSRELRRAMMRERVLIRDCANFRGLDGSYVRVAIRTEPENRRMLDALRAALADAKTPRRIPCASDG